MFPEDGLRQEFWFFVRGRAVDPRIGEDSPHRTATLDTLEERRDVLQYFLADEDERVERYVPGWPVAYDTLQEALLAFLIYEVSNKSYVDFPYDYATWLRTIVLIVANAQRDPSLLTVSIPVDSEGNPESPDEMRRGMPYQEPTYQTRTMSLNGSWDCLSRDTFNFVRRTYHRLG